MKQQFIISAVGPNITGVVARISKEMHNCGCNVEDSGMKVLGDHFALMIQVTGEGQNLKEELENACERLREKGDLSFALFQPEPSSETTLHPKPNYELRVKGADRMGILYRTSQLLASREINILDLQTSLAPSSDGNPPVFTMKTRILVPNNIDHERLRKDMEALAEDVDDVISLTKLN